MQPLDSYLASRPHFERYTQGMNASRGDKFDRIAPQLIPYLEMDKPRFLSIGAGTGVLETDIAKLVEEQGGSVVALDLSLPMLMTINASSRREETGSKQVHPLQADVLHLPFTSKEHFEAIIASSCIHEIASFEDDYQFGEKIQQMFEGFARLLKPGGRLIIRDFMQPENPQEQVVLRIGKKSKSDPMSPARFIERFIQAAPWKVDVEEDGPRLIMSAATAMEFLAHFSWARSFAEESKERYAYLPPKEYAQFVVDAFKKAGCESKIITADSYLQPGYLEHIEGRFQLETLEGKPYPLPNFTGLIVIEKE